MFEGNLNDSGNQIPFEGDPKKSGFSEGTHSIVRGMIKVNIGDPETISNLMKAGVSGPTIFSLVWGWKMAHRGVQFPGGLTKTVSSMEEHIQKKKEACDMQECKLHGIILDLLQVIYEKQVNDIISTILK